MKKNQHEKNGNKTEKLAKNVIQNRYHLAKSADKLKIIKALILK